MLQCKAREASGPVLAVGFVCGVPRGAPVSWKVTFGHLKKLGLASSHSKNNTYCAAAAAFAIYLKLRRRVAVALVVVSLPFLSRICFGTPITVKMLVACALVIGGMYLYVSQPPPKVLEDANEDEGESAGIGGTNEEEEEGDEAELFLPAIPMPYGRKDESSFVGEEQEMTSVLSTATSQIRNSIV